ncbi:discoidin domain-containing protein [Dactylosporangium sp. CA-152071]|uniref:discoidin domain-containing protein n=1 Tax=Dactylosporangium sp. CA-152071 TaxID=3239933 RepID=UPI003D949500
MDDGNGPPLVNEPRHLLDPPLRHRRRRRPTRIGLVAAVGGAAALLVGALVAAGTLRPFAESDADPAESRHRTGVGTPVVGTGPAMSAQDPASASGSTSGARSSPSAGPTAAASPSSSGAPAPELTLSAPLPTGAPAPPGSNGVNLARGKAVTTSSQAGARLAAANAVDGDPASRWASLASDPQWLAVDLGSVYTVERVTLLWESARAKQYAIRVSVDGTQWTVVQTAGDSGGDVDEVRFAAVGARYVQMYGTARVGSYGYSLFEFEVR